MVRFTIHGEPASKANSRKAVLLPVRGGGKRAGFIKSEKALSYTKFALPQIPWHAQKMFDIPVRVAMKIYCCTERPDLDESLILDILQAEYRKDKKTGLKVLVRRGVYVNDRLVRQKFIYHGIDKVNPRADIVVEPLEPVQQKLDGFDNYNAHAEHVEKLFRNGLGTPGRRTVREGR